MTIERSNDHTVEVREQIVERDGLAPVDRQERVKVIRGDGLEHRERIVEDRSAMRAAARFKLTDLVWLLTGFLEFLLLLRIALKLIAANPAAPFVALVYGVTDLFLWPFFGMIGDPAAANGMVLEVSTLIAIIVYAGLAWLLVRLIHFVSTPVLSAGREVRVEHYEEL